MNPFIAQTNSAHATPSRLVLALSIDNGWRLITALSSVCVLAKSKACSFPFWLQLLLLSSHLSLQGQTVIDIAPSSENSAAEALNDHDQVVGWSKDGNGVPRAVMWQNGVLTPLTSEESVASDINFFGQIAGTISGRAVMWKNGKSGEAIPFDMEAGAASINDAGWVVGRINYRGDGKNGIHAKIFQVGDDSRLEHAGTDDGANGINNKDFIVGFAGARPPNAFAAVWSNYAIQKLADNGEALGVNDLNEVVGFSNSEAFRWKGGNLERFGPGTANSIVAKSINNAGSIVGWHNFVDGDRAFMWRDENSNSKVDGDEIRDLTSLLPNSGWVLERANAINNNGVIVGTGRHKDKAGLRAFVLFPTETGAEALTILSQPLSQFVPIGSNLVFNIKVDPPVCLYRWQFNGTNLFDNGRIVGAGSASLVISNAGPTDVGSYSVNIVLGTRKVSSRTAVAEIVDRADSDQDGMPDYWEAAFRFAPHNRDDASTLLPGDRLTALQKFRMKLDPRYADTDGDALSDFDELYVFATDPLSWNTKADGIPDGWKVQHGVIPLISNADQEVGSTGVTYRQIYNYNRTHTNVMDQLRPENAFSIFGSSNYELLNAGEHLSHFHYDKSDRLIGVEYSRGVAIAYGYDANGNLTNQTTLSRASETNGLPSLWLFQHELPNIPNIPYQDADGDGLSNYQEWRARTEPRDPKSGVTHFAAGSNIGTLALPFIPSMFVAATGPLDAQGPDEIVVSADGAPGTAENAILIVSQNQGTWESEQIPIGPVRITSLAAGQLTNRPPAIYAAIRLGDGTGQLLEFERFGGLWTSNVIATSANNAFVVGISVRGDLIATYSPAGQPDGALYSLSFRSNTWSALILSSNASHSAATALKRTAGATFVVRVLDSGLFEVAVPEAVNRPGTDSWYLLTPTETSWSEAQAFAKSCGGNLVTIEESSENDWLKANMTNRFWIGYFRDPGSNYLNPSSWRWASGSKSEYRQWDTEQVSKEPNNATEEEYFAAMNHNGWVDFPSDPVKWPAYQRRGLVEILLPRNTLISTRETTSVALRDRVALSLSRLRPNSLDGISITAVFADDVNGSGGLDFGDEFAFSEFTPGEVPQLKRTRLPVASVNPAQVYASTSVQFDNTGPTYVITAEPDGRLFSWSAQNTTNALIRALFSSHYYGKTWHALASLRMREGEEAIIGVMADASNTTANLILFSKVSSNTLIHNLPPIARILPQVDASHGELNVRIWGPEGNPVLPYLSYKTQSGTNWALATITSVDATRWSENLRVSAPPHGATYQLSWDAARDLALPAGSVASVEFRSWARDALSVGEFSEPIPYTVTIPSDPDTDRDGLPDDWELRHFKSITAQSGVDDFDNDGFNNLAEYLANTNPRDIVLIELKLSAMAADLFFEWTSTPTAMQILETVDTLPAALNTWRPVYTNQPSAPVPVRFPFVNESKSSQFFRLRLE